MFQSLSLLGQFNKMKSWLVGAKFKKKERVNSTFLKVKEKKKSVSWQAENISQVFQFS